MASPCSTSSGWNRSPRRRPILRAFVQAHSRATCRQSIAGWKMTAQGVGHAAQPGAATPRLSHRTPVAQRQPAARKPAAAASTCPRPDRLPTGRPPPGRDHRPGPCRTHQIPWNAVRPGRPANPRGWPAPRRARPRTSRPLCGFPRACSRHHNPGIARPISRCGHRTRCKRTPSLPWPSISRCF